MFAHLVQSTLFAGAAWLLVLSMRRNRARARYAIWLTASLKFLVPFALLVSAGAHLRWRVAPAIPTRAKTFVRHQADTTAGTAIAPYLRIPATRNELITPLAPYLFAVWFSGCAFILTRRSIEWRRIATLANKATPFPRRQRWTAFSIMACNESLEPGVFGIVNPVLLLPANIEDRLTPAQLNAVIAHELFHVERRDNLTASLHVLVEAIFWFHPLVWWIGARLVEERERACDEAVIESGNEAYAYAEGILNVCKYYVQSPSLCVAGVTGSNLRNRIEQIMSRHKTQNLRTGKKLSVAFAAIAVVVTPLFIGVINGKRLLAQPAPILNFDVASVKPGDPNIKESSMLIQPGGHFTTTNASLQRLIGFAYDVRNNQIAGGPVWLKSATFDIEAKPGPGVDVPAGPRGAPKVRSMVQSLLADRFKLTLHRESREQQIYELVVDKSGPKLKIAADSETRRPQGLQLGRGELTGMAAPLSLLAIQLSQQLGYSVIDKTGLSENYDFKLAWTPDAPAPEGRADGSSAPSPSDSSGPSIFTAIREDLGLRLQAAKGPVEVLVIDHIERPTVN
jgi:bla regulator protein BlaR1